MRDIMVPFKVLTRLKQLLSMVRSKFSNGEDLMTSLLLLLMRMTKDIPNLILVMLDFL
jgi:hypothetical protein